MKKQKPEGLFPIIKHYTKKYTSVVIGLFISAVAFNLFFVPTNIVIGGVNGLATTIQLLVHTNLQLTIGALFLFFLVIGFIFLDVKYVSKAIIGSILYPIFIDLTVNVTSYIKIDYTDNLLLIYTFGAIIMGFGAGLIYKRGFSGGGIDILKIILHKKFGISMGKTTVVVNSFIVLLGSIITDNYGNIMYAMIIIYIIGYVTDRVIIGISEQKVFQIVTRKEEEIKDLIVNQLGHNVTVFNVKGGYSNKKENVLLCVIPTKQYFIMKEAIKEIDSNAFFVVSDAYESIGGK